MLIADMFRGMDSTGVFGVNKHGNLDMLKDASASPFFLSKKDSGTQFFNNIISDYHIMVGHNRKATMGVIEAGNAHPFIVGDICLVHNGTLINHKKLADTVVDSQAICTHINEHGYKETLKNIEGAYALIWYNANNKTVYFCRNAERPLYLVETQDRIYLASEGKMLDWLLDRNNILKYTVQNVPTDKVFKFSMDTRKLECESKPKKAAPPAQQQYQNKWNQAGWPNNNQFHNNKTSGQLALVHSSQDLEVTASINTYQSGQNIQWKITDFDIGEKTIQLLGETQDTYKTNIKMFIPTDKMDINKLEEYVAAPLLSGKISSITSKKGAIVIYLSSMKLTQTWETANGIQIDPSKLHGAGSCCYSCGNVVSTPAQVADANITTNSKGEIMYITCGECADSQVLNISTYC